MDILLKMEHYSIEIHQYENGFTEKKLVPVSDLNLELREGEVTALVGASGSGKSLLAHGILGILPYNAAASGTLWYRGEILTQERLLKLRGNEIVLVPQSASFLDPLMKVGKQICQGRPNAARKEKMYRILEEYHLGPEVAEKYPFELSGGMIRRIFLTAARMGEPGLVIADEPTPGLDRELASLVLGHLRELAEKGAGVLLITHDLEQALAAAHRIVVFYEGKKIEEGKTERFLHHETLCHPYTRALWQAMPGNGFICPDEEGVRI